MTYSQLLVVTSPRWVAEDLGRAGTIEVGHSMGLDAPVLDGSTALWCSGSWATRLQKSGIAHPFLSPGPDWMATVPDEFLDRKVWTGTLGDLPYVGIHPTFYKLAEHKHTSIPAGLHIGRSSFQSTVIRAFVSEDSFEVPAELADLHVVGSEPMSYAREFRCFIAHGTVTASSFYLASVPGMNHSTVTITWDAYEPATAPKSDTAARFAQSVVDAMGDCQPPGYTLDVGEDAHGNWSVIEANAAWSSNIYHADPAGVIESVLAAQEPGHPQWSWAPDALFLNRARPLPGASR